MSDEMDEDNSFDVFVRLPGGPSATQAIKNERAMIKLREIILAESDNDEFLSKTKLILKFLQDGLLQSDDGGSSFMLKSDEDAFQFTSMVREAWKDPLFVRAVRATIKEDETLIGDFLDCSKNDSPTDRIARMEADQYFKYFLMKIKSNTPTKYILRTFLSVLIGHWTCQDVLLELDELMGEHHFEDRINWMAECEVRALARKGKEVETHELSFTMESSSEVETLEGFRKELIRKYGEGRHEDIEAIVNKAKPTLILLLGINEGIGYGGGKVRIDMIGHDDENYHVSGIDWATYQDQETKRIKMIKIKIKKRIKIKIKIIK